jgi:hypothetical protein
MNSQDIFTDVIVQYCDTETLSRLARTCCAHYLVIRENPIYREFADKYTKLGNIAYHCRCGHINIAKYMHSRGVDIHKRDELSLKNACKGGYMDIVIWIYSLGCDINARSYAFATACEYGHLELAQWLYEPAIKTYPRCCPFRLACGGGHLEVAQWLHNVNFNICEPKKYSFRYACGRGRLHVAKWFWEYIPHDEDTVIEAFENACENGSLCVVKWLCDLGIDVTRNIRERFWLICRRNIDVAKWFHESGVCNERTYSVAFGDACICNNITNAIWLVDKVDFSGTYGDSLFISVCEKGHFKIAQLLYETDSIDAHTAGSGFRAACERGHSKLARWLVYRIINLRCHRIWITKMAKSVNLRPCAIRQLIKFRDQM